MSGLPEALDAPRRILESPAAGRVSYYADDSVPGRPLVLVHSINAAPSAMEVRPLFERYRGHRPVYAPDLPGFGFSDRSPRDYTPDLYAAAITDLLKEVGGGPADVVALSLAAELTARAALARPASFASLALISPTGLGARALPGEAAGRRTHRFLSLPGVGRGLYFLLTSRPSIRWFLDKSFAGTAPPEMVDYAHATARQPGARHAPFHFLSFKLFTRHALERLYAPLDLPLLVLYDRDPNLGFERLPELVDGRTERQAVRIAPSRGLPHWEHPERTGAALEAFWARGAGTGH